MKYSLVLPQVSLIAGAESFARHSGLLQVRAQHCKGICNLGAQG